MTEFAERQPIGCECGDHFFATATKGYVVLVSPEDVALLRRKWGVRRVDRNISVVGKAGVLARLIVRPAPGQQVDHQNCDGADNRRANLRTCTAVENSRNRRTRRDSQSGLKGVFCDPSRPPGTKRYRVSISHGGKRHYLGHFHTEKEAREAYVAAAARLFGDFARAG